MKYFARREHKTYRKIQSISPGFINIRKHFLEDLCSGGLIFGGLIFGGHFVLVSANQDYKNYYHK